MEKLHYLVNILKRDLIEKGESNIGVSYRGSSVKVEIEKINDLTMVSRGNKFRCKEYACHLKVKKNDEVVIESCGSLYEEEMEGFFKEINGHIKNVFNEK